MGGAWALVGYGSARTLGTASHACICVCVCVRVWLCFDKKV
jgi:hypothetical protein